MLRMTCAVICCAGLATAASADGVTDWNKLLLDSIAATNVAPPAASRMMAMVHTAQFEAINSIDRNYRCYNAYLDCAADSDRSAAAAQAARDVLTMLFPTRQSIFDAKLSADLASVPNAAARSNGIALGMAAASQTIAGRASDNSSMSITYTGGNAIGQWRPTPPGNAAAALPHWRYVSPWSVQSAQQFMPGPPPAVGSAEYAVAYDEVKRLGSVNSAERTQHQTDTAFLWRAGSNTVTPPGQWFEIASQAVAQRNLSIGESARLFALIGMAVADAGITAWETKNTYDFWRPITGIQLGDADGSSLTAGDPLWRPLITTPNHQSYTSGHSTFSSAAATVLASYFGDQLNFTVSGDGVTRQYSSFWAAAQDAGMSRIYGGIHWQFDNQAGLASGSSVGRWVFDHALAVPAPSALAMLGLAAMTAGRRRR